MSLGDQEKTSSEPEDSGSISTNSHVQDPNHSLEAQDTNVSTGDVTFPEGGLRAWSVVAATACILFCTFGYANAFGYDTNQALYLIKLEGTNFETVSYKNITRPIN